MEEICRRAETLEIRRNAARELRGSVGETAGKDLSKSSVFRLETAAKAGDIQAACKAAAYYLSHARVRARRIWAEEDGEWLESESKSSLWPQAAAMLNAALRCPKPEERAALSLLLLWHGLDIKEGDPVLHGKLVSFSK